MFKPPKLVNWSKYNTFGNNYFLGTIKLPSTEEMFLPLENILNKNKDRDKTVAIYRAHSETCHFMCCTSKSFKYFINLNVCKILKTRV